MFDESSPAVHEPVQHHVGIHRLPAIAQVSNHPSNLIPCEPHAREIVDEPFHVDLHALIHELRGASRRDGAPTLLLLLLLHLRRRGGVPLLRRVPTVPARRWRRRVGRRRRRRVVVVVVVAVWTSRRRRSVGRRTRERRRLRWVPRMVVRWRAAAVGRPTNRGLMRSGGRWTRGCVRGCRRGGRGRVWPLLRHGWSRDGRDG